MGDTPGPAPRTYPAPVEDGGRLQDPASHVSHLIFDHDSKFPDVGVGVETRTSHLGKGRTGRVRGVCAPRAVSVPTQRPQDGTLTSLLISSCRSGADLAVALIMVEV